MKLKISSLKVVIILLLFLYLIPIVIFAVNFYGHSISKESSNWGAFGDFTNGIISPILSIANIIALLYLTITIAKSDDAKHKQALELQRELHKEEQNNQKAIRKGEIKYLAYKDFINLFTKINNALLDVDNILYGVTVAFCKIEFTGFVYLNRATFLTLQNTDRINKIAQELSSLGLLLNKTKKNISEQKMEENTTERVKLLVIALNGLVEDLQKELE